MLIEAENTESYNKISTTRADECVRQNPQSVEALIVRSRIFVLKKDFNSALADANKAVELTPQSSDAFYARGFVYSMNWLQIRDNKTDFSAEDIKNKSSALADYEKSLELNPKNGLALLDQTVFKSDGVGLSFRSLKPDYTRAIEYLTASGNTAELARAYYERGKANMKDKWDSAGAIEDYTTALKLRPNYLPPLAGRAYAHRYGVSPNLEASIADYTEYLKIKPSAYMYTLRAYVYEFRGEKAKAINDFRAALALEPDYSAAKADLARLLTPTNPTPSQPTPSSPNQPTAEQFAAEGRQQISQKNYDAAIKSFSECLRLKPGVAACYAFRGMALGMKGDSAASKTDFETAIKLEPNQVGTYIVRGIMHVGLGKKAEAIEDFRAALKIDPNNREAKQALQRLGVQ